MRVAAVLAPPNDPMDATADSVRATSRSANSTIADLRTVAPTREVLETYDVGTLLCLGT